MEKKTDKKKEEIISMDPRLVINIIKAKREVLKELAYR